MAVGELTLRRAVALGVGAGLAVLASASWAGAHGGDSAAVHGCVVPSSGYLRIVDPDETCKTNETALDWTSGALAPGSVLGEGNNVADGLSGHLALGTVGRANLVPEAVDTAQLAPRAVTGDRVSNNDASNLTGANVRTGTLHGTLMGPPTTAHTGDIALGTISGQGDNVDADANNPKGNLGLDTVGRHNLVDGAVDVTKLSSLLLDALVTQGELDQLLAWLDQGDDSNLPSDRTANDGDGLVHWNHLDGVPWDIIDGDDDGTEQVQQLREELRGTSTDDTPNDSDDLVSLDEVMGLTTTGGDGRIVGGYIEDGTITASDLADDSVVMSKLNEDVVGRFETLESRLTNLSSPASYPEGDFIHPTRLSGWTDAPVLANPTVIGAMSRGELVVPIPGLQNGDLVTVSPPQDLPDDLLFVGHDVQRRPVEGVYQDVVVVYLYNNTPADIDDEMRTWRIQYLEISPY